jgi:hypothetical protein
MTALASEIEAAERAVWQALLAGDAAADRAALTVDFLGVYPDGFAGAEDHAAQLAGGPSIAEFTLSQVTVRALGPDHALIVYRADYRRVTAVAFEAMYVSSIWRSGAAGWLNLFSQDTPATGERLP